MIHYRNDVRNSGVDGAALKRAAATLLREAGAGTSDLSLLLVNDDAMQAINYEHRGKDGPTDVLSFPALEFPDGPSTSALRAYARDDRDEILLGDIVISIDTARRQASEYDATLQDELYRLLIHGILHVLGHDHEKADERNAMQAEEQRLAAAIGLTWPFP